MARFEAGNEALRRRFFPELETLFFDESENYPIEQPPAPSDRELFEAACAAFATAMPTVLPPKKPPGADRVAAPGSVAKS